MKRRKYNRGQKSKWHPFKSPLEKEIIDELALIKNKKFKYQYEGERLKYFVVKHYTPDVILTLPNGKKIYIEIKGYLRYEDQVKMRAVKNSNPELDIRFVFTDRSRVGSSNMTPGQWCTKYGFDYTTEGKIPKQWTKLQKSRLDRIKSARNVKQTNPSKPTTKTVVLKMGTEPTAKTA